MCNINSDCTCYCKSSKTVANVVDNPLTETDGRLPRDLSPYHYNVELRPDIYNKTPCYFGFDGIVSIYFTVINSTNIITVNAQGLINAY